MFQEKEQFETSSGRIVKVGVDGSVMFDRVNGFLTAESAIDAAEFYEAKRDVDLGRWRWPENPHLVVYVHGDSVAVVDESNGDRAHFLRSLCTSSNAPLAPDGLHAAAHAYYETHQAATPWDGMQVGEIWMVTLHNVEQPCRVVATSHSGLGFLPLTDHAATWFSPSPAVTGAYRLWPSDES